MRAPYRDRRCGTSRSCTESTLLVCRTSFPISDTPSRPQLRTVWDRARYLRDKIKHYRYGRRCATPRKARLSRPVYFDGNGYETKTSKNVVVVVHTVRSNRRDEKPRSLSSRHRLPSSLPNGPFNIIIINQFVYYHVETYIFHILSDFPPVRRSSRSMCKSTNSEREI